MKEILPLPHLLAILALCIVIISVFVPEHEKGRFLNVANSCIAAAAGLSVPTTNKSEKE